ncbi:TetR family transcriptional regulator [Desulfallas thermosapovorans DSM 6562]|uniref:TetR family transcriptional regulator n=2 Tax=Desulfallas thermosapovorans TaxID=58137 RepID=A0A5S4ZQG7_9FIRM|nr:TetR family transcriptional regulator [Desulfallas thermosapovorans DSM 6562]
MGPVKSEKVISQMEEKRQNILSCAVKIFVQKGYMNTPVRDIIDASGYGTSTFYRYFKDKEDLLNTLLLDFLDHIIDQVNRYFKQEQDVHKRFVESKRVIMEVFAQNPELSEIYSRVAGLSEAVDKILKEFDDRYLWFVHQNIAYGIKHGYFKDLPLDPICHSILAMIKYAVHKWVVLKEISSTEMIEMVVDFHRCLGEGLYAPHAPSGN